MAIGTLLGCMYSYASILVVSPLTWLVAFMAARLQHDSIPEAFLVGTAAIALLQGAYFIGVLVRFREELDEPEADAKSSGLQRWRRGFFRP